MDFVENLYKNFITQMNVLRRQVGSLLTTNQATVNPVNEITPVVNAIDQAIDDANLGTSWLSQDLLKITQLLLPCKENLNLEDEDTKTAWLACQKIMLDTAVMLCEHVDDEIALQVKTSLEQETL